ncbi:hypothetical protein FSB73_19875 [Arachidicoccus ginsenosidivorans]|jgi:hypothetical protein|uniref:Uncharacterized protein n=1 Tax=Arachidicoccus ginsenosidivorans TaxID=496057 RepID=A0A5B8VS94_9BACT|nr:hypothetical protein [Arachidicoccus ginsenosidivorans]QEC73586.1 hypothetical protein FSB73_19875 [Arachidicoccus ginsenosidivorans]
MNLFAMSSPGLIMIGIGIAIKYFVKRRRFYRRNQYGMEVYKNFASASANGCLNKLASLLGTACILIGILLSFGGCMSKIWHPANGSAVELHPTWHKAEKRPNGN